MEEIFYSGIVNGTLNLIRSQLQKPGRKLEELPEREYKSVFSTANKDALLLGERVYNPIKVAQEIHSIDKNLSILIITEPAHLKQFKQALQFTPFIGSTVHCIPNGDPDKLISTIEIEIERTQQRRNFENLVKVTPQVERSFNIEQIQKEYIDRFFEFAPIGAVLLDKKGLILASNRFTNKVFNLPEKDLLGHLLIEFFPENKAELHQFLQTDFTSIEKKLFERIKAGQKQFLEISIAEIDSSFGFKIGIIEDISDKVYQVNELKKVNFDLDSFIYTASHDLKAPISNIEGLVDALKDLHSNQSPSPNEVRTLLEMIAISVSRFKKTILSLTEVTKIQKNISDDVDHINLYEILEEVKSDIQELIKHSKAQISIDIENCFEISFSRTSLRSILYNLLSNAIKYRSPERTPEIKIKCGVKDNYMLLQVSDNGLGLSSTNQGSLFKMFKRFHDHVEGTGIGLYIVKRIVENNGGKIEVESELSKGTTFKLYFKF